MPLSYAAKHGLQETIPNTSFCPNRPSSDTNATTLRKLVIGCDPAKILASRRINSCEKEREIARCKSTIDAEAFTKGFQELFSFRK